MRLLLTILLLTPALTHAWNWDLSQDALARSYPIGGVYQVRTGLTQTFWDKRTEGIKSPFYGFVRGGALLRSSGLINTAEGELALYPVSFFGLFHRQSYSVRRLSSLDTFDCDQIDCRGEIQRREWGGRLAMAFKGFFLMNEQRWITFDPSTNGAILADEMTTMELLNQESRQHIRLTILGYQFNDQWSGGILNLDNRLRDPKENTYKLMGLGQFKKDDWTLAGALGIFHTRFDSDVLSALVIWKYNYRMGDMLF